MRERMQGTPELREKITSELTTAGRSTELPTPIETPFARTSRELSGIWQDFYRQGGDKNPNAVRQKGERMLELDRRTDPDIMRQFEQPIDSGDETVSPITYGMKIRSDAQETISRQVAEAERAKREEAKTSPPKKSNKSAGERLHERRRKAQERRGTNPKDIH